MLRADDPAPGRGNAALGIVAIALYVIPAALVLLLVSLARSAARLEDIASGRVAPI